jgi:hypothetical protein
MEITASKKDPTQDPMKVPVLNKINFNLEFVPDSLKQTMKEEAIKGLTQKFDVQGKNDTVRAALTEEIGNASISALSSNTQQAASKSSLSAIPNATEILPPSVVYNVAERNSKQRIATRKIVTYNVALSKAKAQSKQINKDINKLNELKKQAS